MIRKIHIQGYRSCLDTSFELHPNLSVLIGPNSSGKTNILNALLLLRKLTEEYQFYHRSDEEPTGQCTLKVWFDIDNKQAILSSVVNIFTDDSNNDVILSSRQQWYAKDFTGKGKRIALPLWLAREFMEQDESKRMLRYYRFARHPSQIARGYKIPSSVQSPLAQIANDLSVMRYYSASQFTNPTNCPVSFEIDKEGKTSRGIGLHGHAKLLFDLYTSYKSQDDTNYEQFFEIIGPKGIGLVDALEFKEMPTSSIDYRVRSGGDIIERKRERILVIPQFRIGNNALSPNQLSEGTFKTITLLFYLITETSKVLLVEEPEVCVHHGLLSSIIELIKTYSRDKQIVISTHSDFVLDEVRPENVYRVTNSAEEGTKIYHVPKAMSRLELTALHEYLETEGNLGEYWRHGGLD